MLYSCAPTLPFRLERVRNPDNFAPLLLRFSAYRPFGWPTPSYDWQPMEQAVGVCSRAGCPIRSS
jgi:hypothetical protein